MRYLGPGDVVTVGISALCVMGGAKANAAGAAVTQPLSDQRGRRAGAANNDDDAHGYCTARKGGMLSGVTAQPRTTGIGHREAGLRSRQ